MENSVSDTRVDTPVHLNPSQHTNNVGEETATETISLGTVKVTNTVKVAVYTAVKDAFLRTIPVRRPVNEDIAAANRVIIGVMEQILAGVISAAVSTAVTATVRDTPIATMSVSDREGITDAIAEGVWSGVSAARSVCLTIKANPETDSKPVQTLVISKQDEDTQTGDVFGRQAAASSAGVKDAGDCA